MRTVGQILRETREAHLYTLDDVEKHTKIRREMLEALEADQYDKLPPSTFVQGFIKNYGKFLGLDTNKLLAFFRRDFEAKKHVPLVMDSFAHPLKEKRFRLSPTHILGSVIGLVVLSFFIYLWFEYRQFVGAPMLEVTSPISEQSVEVPEVKVAGQTEPEVKVTVNNQEIGVDSDGKFVEDIKLSSSVNTITIVATGKFGRSAKKDITVYVKQ